MCGSLEIELTTINDNLRYFKFLSVFCKLFWCIERCTQYVCTQSENYKCIRLKRALLKDGMQQLKDLLKTLKQSNMEVIHNVSCMTDHR